jgi:hypothetical protein
MENQNNSNSAANTSTFTVTAELAKRYSPEQLKQIQAAIARSRAERTVERGGTPTQGRSQSPERAAYLASYRAGVEERKAARAVKRAEKQEAAASFVPHIGKILAAGANLPELGEDATEVLSMFQSLSISDRAALAAHVNHTIREAQTLMSLTTSLHKGQIVQVTGGDPRYIGMIGTLTDVRRIRSFVQVAGMDKQLYVFSADVTPVAEKVEEDVFDTTLEDDAARGL